MQDRLMVFVDGSNLLRSTATIINAAIRSDKPTKDAIYLCGGLIDVLISQLAGEAHLFGFRIIRKYWFGSIHGTDKQFQNLCINLRRRSFEPVIFKKHKGKEKRVDIAIAREMLINAFNKNYDLALLIAGDEDYVDLVYDLKRLGIRVIGSFYEVGLSDRLRLAVDNFHQLYVWGTANKPYVEALGGVFPKK